MIWLELGLALLGLIGLFYGAEWLVGGSSRLAFHLGISPLIVGLTIVAFGTSSPELLVALRANLQGNGSLVMGNVTGSNIYNLALILGIGAFIYPLKVPRQLLVRDMPIMLLASFALSSGFSMLVSRSAPCMSESCSQLFVQCSIYLPHQCGMFLLFALRRRHGSLQTL